MEQFFAQFFGTADTTGFLVSFLFALVGVIISLGWQVKKRDKISTHTPYQFKFWFLIRDNALRVLMTLLMIFVVIRFYPDLMGSPISFYTALMAGLGLDKISEQVKLIQTKARR